MRVFDLLPLLKGDLSNVQLEDVNDEFNCITLNKAIKVLGVTFLSQIISEEIKYNVDYESCNSYMTIVCSNLPEKLYTLW